MARALQKCIIYHNSHTFFSCTFLLDNLKLHEIFEILQICNLFDTEMLSPYIFAT